jgi:hypothetical protein
MTPEPDELVQEAGILQSWGFPTFPLARKRPRCPWKQFQYRRPSDREIGRLFRLPDVDGIGVVPGPFSGGFAVRDYDDPSAYHRWVEAHPEIADLTPTVRTKRGFHVWSRSTVPVFRAFDDGEFLGDGRHFCVVPPTRHPKGGAYQWLNGPPLGPSEFPTLDPFKAGFLSESTPDGGVRVDIRHSLLLCVFPTSGSEGCLPAPIRECILRTLPTKAGKRNGRLHQLARALRDHVPDDAPPGLLYDTVGTWWRMALPVIGTKDFATTLCDFRRAWAAVRVPMSQSRPLMALRRGSSVSSEADSRARLLNACRELAAETGGEFYLSARTAGKGIGIGKSRADVLLKELVSSGHLVVFRRGRASRTGRRGTTVYRLGNAEPERKESA